ncbi:MAG: methylaspartate mutase subunit E [Chloroflexi bacterium]|nr:methylaspartate mutase subunit E [Chloroflexota bacterium]
MELRNERWDEKTFKETMKEVLAMYPTGKAVTLDRILEYQKGLPPRRRASNLYDEARKTGRIMVHPRAGVATIEGMIDLLTYLQDEGGADILPMTPDTYTRRLQFDNARKGLEESIRLGRSMLNGFPVVEHGVPGCRRLVEAVKRPVSVRCTTGTARLAITIALASGVTEMASAAVHCAFTLDTVPFEAAIKDWQYTERLVGWLEERGLPITMEFNCVSGASAVNPPALAVVVNILDVLLAAEQGVKHFCVTHYLNNTVIQDLAGIRMMGELTRRYLDEFGYRDAVVYQSCNHWHGAYPGEVGEAFAVIDLSSVIASYGKVNKIMVRSVEEGVGVPTRESNASSLRATRHMVDMLANQEFPHSPKVEEEAKLIEAEVKQIMDRVLDLGNGDIAIGTVKAVKSGILDVPFTPNPENVGKVLMVKDLNGFVRYLDPGNLPLSKEIVQFHEEKVKERIAAEKWDDEYEMLAYDIRGGRRL